MSAEPRQGRKREALVAALLAEPTIEAAARAAGVSERTARRWLHDDPGFQITYREARQEAVRTAVCRLEVLLTEATHALSRALTCGVPTIELRAAVNAFTLTFRGTEQLDLMARVAALEKSLDPEGGDP